MATTHKLGTVEECQERLGYLAEEEAALPALKESKEKELEEARQCGDYIQASILSAQVDDLNGPRLKRIIEMVPKFGFSHTLGG
jgi:hypothetical protein